MRCAVGPASHSKWEAPRRIDSFLCSRNGCSAHSKLSKGGLANERERLLHAVCNDGLAMHLDVNSGGRA
jgi:hypothetical protein